MPRGFSSQTPFQPKRVVSIGKSQVGVAFHSHGATCLVQRAGTKRWFLYAPDAFPKKDEHHQLFLLPVSAWRNANNVPSDMKVCSVGPGDAMLLPAHWWHATENIGETAAVGWQV